MAAASFLLDPQNAGSPKTFSGPNVKFKKTVRMPTSRKITKGIYAVQWRSSKMFSVGHCEPFP